jgi:hypothetical protein
MGLHGGSIAARRQAALRNDEPGAISQLPMICRPACIGTSSDRTDKQLQVGDMMRSSQEPIRRASAPGHPPSHTAAQPIAHKSQAERTGSM